MEEAVADTQKPTKAMWKMAVHQSGREMPPGTGIHRGKRHAQALKKLDNLEAAWTVLTKAQALRRSTLQRQKEAGFSPHRCSIYCLLIALQIYMCHVCDARLHGCWCCGLALVLGLTSSL